MTAVSAVNLVAHCPQDGNTRIFGVQQPVYIVLASRSADSKLEAPAAVRFASLQCGRREAKFEALRAVFLLGFSYRKKDRSRPIIGDRRKPSALNDIQPDHWLAEYTTELINVLNVLGLFVDLEPVQADLLTRICDGPTISLDELSSAGALNLPSKKKEAVKYTLLDNPGD